jgi:hypothetical protein
MPPNQPKFSHNENLAVSDCINRLIEIGAISKVVSESGQFVSKIFVVPKSNGKFRLVLNLKKFNKFVEFEHFKMEDYRTVCNLLEKDIFMASVDIQDAFHLIPIDSSHRRFLRFEWLGQMYEYTCLPFGLSSAPRTFTKVLRPVLNHIRVNGHLSSMYLDDLFILGRTEEKCQKSVEFCCQLFESLGLLINDKSHLNPTTEIEYLGFIFNSVDMKLSLPIRKQSKIISMCNELLRANEITIQKISEVIGTLVAAAPATSNGMLYTRELEMDKTFALIKSCGNYSGTVKLSNGSRSDLVWWIGKGVFSSNRISRDVYDICITTDASKTGWGAHTDMTSTHGFWTIAQKAFHINVLELIAVRMGLGTFLKDKTNLHVLVKTDNTVAMAYLNKLGGCGSINCHRISKDILSWCENRNISLKASYIKSKDNFIADFESRLLIDETEWILKSSEYDKICEKLGSPTIDLFASYHSHKCERYISWHPDPSAEGVDAFSMSWRNDFFYAFPPFSMITRVLK